MKVKGLHLADVAEIQKAVTDKLRSPNRGIFGSFSETVPPRKSLYICHLSPISVGDHLQAAPS